MTLGQFAIDWEERVDFARLRKERVERARRAMKDHGLDAILAFDADHLRYITGTFGNPGRALAASRYAILARDRDPILYELGGDLGRQRQCAPWLGDRIKPSYPMSFLPRDQYKDWALHIKKVLKEEGVASGKVGIDQMFWHVVNALREAGVDAVDGGGALWDARMVKTRDELELIKLSVALAEPSLEVAKRLIRPGVRDCDVQAQALAVKFANNCWIYHGGGNFASGEHTNPYWRLMLTDRIIRHGDLVIIDSIHTHNGYACDYVRTFLCGDKATREQKDLYRECYDYMYGGIKVVKPGATTGDIVSKWHEPEDFSESTLDFAHGIGLGTHEPPHMTFLSKKNPVKIRANMALALETYVGKPGGKQGVRLEENLIVTETGYEIISKYPHDERLFEG